MARPHLLATFVLVVVVSGCSAAAIESIGFGTGGSQCTLANQAPSFAVGVPVQFVATFSPDLPAGSSVAISLSRDGTALPDLSGTVNVDVAENCIGGTWKSLDAGHYLVTLTVSSGTGMPPLAGEFDVTPAK